MRSSLHDQGIRMIWVLLEVGIALGLAVAIVWWTIPKKKSPAKDMSESDKQSNASEARAGPKE